MHGWHVSALEETVRVVLARLWRDFPLDSADQMCESDQEVAIADDEMSDRMP